MFWVFPHCSCERLCSQFVRVFGLACVLFYFGLSSHSFRQWVVLVLAHVVLAIVIVRHYSPSSVSSLGGIPGDSVSSILGWLSGSGFVHLLGFVRRLSMCKSNEKFGNIRGKPGHMFNLDLIADS